LHYIIIKQKSKHQVCHIIKCIIFLTHIFLWCYYRVPAGKSFFTLNSTNLPQCVNETTNVSNCSCSIIASNNITVCNAPVDPGSVAVPQFQARFADRCLRLPVLITRRRRRRRDIVSSLENVLVDDSMLYTPLPMYNYTSMVPVVNISRADAMTQCYANFPLTPAYEICKMYVNISRLLEQCVMDIQVGNNYVVGMVCLIITIYLKGYGMLC